jgi:hypothetical protein
MAAGTDHKREPKPGRHQFTFPKGEPKVTMPCSKCETVQINLNHAGRASVSGTLPGIERECQDKVTL